MNLSFRIASQELKDGGLLQEHNIGSYSKIKFNNIAVSLGPYGGSNCKPPGTENLVLDDMCYWRCQVHCTFKTFRIFTG